MLADEVWLRLEVSVRVKLSNRQEWQTLRQQFQDEIDEFNAVLDAIDTGGSGYTDRDYFRADVRVKESFRQYTIAMRRMFGPAIE